MMIDDTTTPYFLILDGDEVYYKDGIEAVVQAVNNWPEGKVCGFVPLIWFKDIEHTFHISRSGRIFKTEDVGMSNSSPNEIHTVKKTGERIGPNSSCTFSVPGMKPYAHFETMLKPWRRSVPPSKLQVFAGVLPEVMRENMSFVERFVNESASSNP